MTHPNCRVRGLLIFQAPPGLDPLSPQSFRPLDKKTVCMALALIPGDPIVPGPVARKLHVRTVYVIGVILFDLPSISAQCLLLRALIRSVTLAANGLHLAARLSGLAIAATAAPDEITTHVLAVALNLTEDIGLVRATILTIGTTIRPPMSGILLLLRD